MSDYRMDAFYIRLHTSAMNYSAARRNNAGFMLEAFYNGEMCGILNGAYMLDAISLDEFNRGFDVISALMEAYR